MNKWDTKYSSLLFLRFDSIQDSERKVMKLTYDDSKKEDVWLHVRISIFGFVGRLIYVSLYQENRRRFSPNEI